MPKVVRKYEAGGAQLAQLEDGNVLLWNADGDAVEIDRADLAAVAREITAAHVFAGRLHGGLQ